MAFPTDVAASVDVRSGSDSAKGSMDSVGTEVRAGAGAREEVEPEAEIVEGGWNG
jgi:hypothetical protein